MTAASGDAGAAGEAPGLGYVALGVAAIAGAAAAGVARRGADTVARALDYAPKPVTNAVDGLAERGRRELENLIETAEATVAWATPFVARYPPLLRFVDEMVDAVLPSAIASALPTVLDQLANDPNQLRAVVRSQSTDISDELIGLVRTRATYGDELVDRVVRRVGFRRRPKAQPETAPADAPAPAPTTVPTPEVPSPAPGPTAPGLAFQP